MNDKEGRNYRLFIYYTLYRDKISRLEIFARWAFPDFHIQRKWSKLKRNYVAMVETWMYCKFIPNEVSQSRGMRLGATNFFEKGDRSSFDAVIPTAIHRNPK